MQNARMFFLPLLQRQINVPIMIRVARYLCMTSYHKRHIGRMMTYSVVKFLGKHCAKLQNNCSCLYSTSLFASDRDIDSTYFTFDHDLAKNLQDMEKLQHNLKLRGISFDIHQLKANYEELCSLDKKRSAIEQRRSEVAHHIAVIVKNQKESKTNMPGVAEKMKILKEEGKTLKEAHKVVQAHLWEVEEKVIRSALSLPNEVHPDVPEDKEVIVEDYLADKRLRIVDKDHHVILEESNMVKISNVGSRAYYLRGRLAVLEQELIDRFTTELHRKGLTMILAPEMFKTALVEAGGLDVVDPSYAYRLKHKEGSSLSDWDQDHMFLRGASHLSFLAYYARMQISSDSLPVRNFTVGRNYRPVNAVNKTLPGLFGALQSVRVCACTLAERMEECSTECDMMVQAIKEIYREFDLPFRIVSIPVQLLCAYEQKRLEVQIWVPTMQTYLKVGSVAAHGDFHSRRLMIRSARDRQDAVEPVHMVYSDVTDITTMLAVLLEHGRLDKYWRTM
ncbi:serine--tRNA synthetase-like protein Slimp [Dreissena polymorpha]|nr:serine--tRNA synthetase-like protein Slimp [Dreissena polymorpha]